jgi:hypothetical protein
VEEKWALTSSTYIINSQWSWLMAPLAFKVLWLTA